MARNSQGCMSLSFGETMVSVASSPGQHSHHVESLDGIRGVAILMVLSMHAGWFGNGWIGVDLFFVLSGFLITGILRRTRIEAFYWRRFYIKRATRILPPLLLVIAVTVIFWPHPSPIGIASYALSLGNIVDMTRFAVYPIGHLWSLSVEEHYYLLWPLAVLRLPRRQLQWLLFSIIMIVPLGRLVFTYLLSPNQAYAINLFTPFRIDGIALGSLLALLLEQRPWQERLTKWSGAGAVLASTVFLVFRGILGRAHFRPYSYSPIFNSIGYSLVAIIAFFVIAYASLLPDAIPTRILRNRMLTKLGAISYGLYVYSWIILVLMRHNFPRLSEGKSGLIHVLVSLPVAAVLFVHYEGPITIWGRRTAARLAAKANVAVITAIPDTEKHAFEVEKPNQASVAAI
jgi:peptidoglycan/LPS O-acetylase OafA/YrhL